MFRTFVFLMYTSFYTSPVGLLRIHASDSGLLSVSFTDSEIAGEAPYNRICLDTAQQLDEYFHHKREVFDLPLTPEGTAFQQLVWKELVQVSFGKTDSYSSIAHKLNNPLSVRAVGAANGKNPIAIIIPCHRIIGADGSLTGYAGGLWRKEFLLRHEGLLKSIQTSLF